MYILITWKTDDTWNFIGGLNRTCCCPSIQAVELCCPGMYCQKWWQFVKICDVATLFWPYKSDVMSRFEGPKTTSGSISMATLFPWLFLTNLFCFFGSVFIFPCTYNCIRYIYICICTTIYNGIGPWVWKKQNKSKNNASPFTWSSSGEGLVSKKERMRENPLQTYFQRCDPHKTP